MSSSHGAAHRLVTQARYSGGTPLLEDLQFDRGRRPAAAVCRREAPWPLPAIRPVVPRRRVSGLTARQVAASSRQSCFISCMAVNPEFVG